MILAFDTSGPYCAAAVVSGERVLAQALEPMAKGQAERLLGLCADLLQDANVTWQDLYAVGVGVGPGNFTGLRIAVSAARGLALGLGVPAVGVTSFEALALGQSGPCACAVDARRGQIYLQGFRNPALTQPAIFDHDALPEFAGPLIGEGGVAPIHPIAVAIAHIAQMRHTAEQPRPAPLYLRPADAAPARDTAPVILP